MATYNGWDLTSMIDVDYLDQIRDGLVPKMVTEGITTSIVDVIPGVKNAMTLNSLDNTITVQADDCTFSPAGNVGLVQKELRVYPKKVNDALCPKDLETTYLAMRMRGNEIPFVEELAQSYVNKINAFNEAYIWMGNDDDEKGLLQLINVDDDTVNASNEVAGADTYIGKMNALLAAAPTEVLTSDEGVVFCSFAFFQNYMNELRAANLFFMANAEYKNNGWTALIPGTNVKLIATKGISDFIDAGNHDIYGEVLVYTLAKNIAVGTDMLGNDENFDIWYSRDAREYRVDMSWKIGANYRWSDRIVKGYSF
jgi:hypothetical protein